MSRRMIPLPTRPLTVALSGALLLFLSAACGGGQPAATVAPASTQTRALPTAPPTPTLAPTPIPPTATAAPTPTPELIRVPVGVKGARNVGALHVELVYDAAVLEAVSFDSGDLSRNALIDADLDTPGRVVIGIVDTEGIDGDGAVAVVSFKPLGRQGDSALSLENVTAHDATTLIDVTTTVTNGSFAAGNRAISLPDIVFDGGN